MSLEDWCIAIKKHQKRESIQNLKQLLGLYKENWFTFLNFVLDFILLLKKIYL